MNYVYSQISKNIFQCYMHKCVSNRLYYYYLLWRYLCTASYQYLSIIPDYVFNICLALIKNALELDCFVSNIIPPPMWTPWYLYSYQYNPFTNPRIKISRPPILSNDLCWNVLLTLILNYKFVKNTRENICVIQNYISNK